MKATPKSRPSKARPSPATPTSEITPDEIQRVLAAVEDLTAPTDAAFSAAIGMVRNVAKLGKFSDYPEEMAGLISMVVWGYRAGARTA
jgi:hypothetical protein